MNVVVDVNEQGPVVEEVLSQRTKLRSLKTFMITEGHTMKQLNESIERAQEKGVELEARAVARWRLSAKYEDGHVMPWAFDRWRRFIKIRQLVGWTLNNLENRLQNFRCDLSWSFNKWK